MLEIRYPDTTPSDPSAAPDLAEHADAIVEGAVDAVFCCAPNGVITVFNAAAERLYGRSRGEVLGRPLAALLGECVTATAELLDRALDGEPVSNCQTRHPRADGSPVEVAVAASAVLVGDECAGVSFFVRDISERREGERELARTRSLLERHASELGRSNADLEQFAYVASHDLSEPLRAITGMLALLQEECGSELSEDAEEYIRRANGGAARMRVLIDDLLAYSRVGREMGDRGPVDLGELFDEVATGIGVRVGEEVAAVTPLPVVEGSRTQLRQLLQNLLSNGLKFNTSERPRVELAARGDGATWTFSVTDNGIGIPAEYNQRVFGVFKRLHTRDAYSGTGIGLAICQRVVERHGGTIWVEPGRAAGTDLRFTLPAAAAEGESDA